MRNECVISPEPRAYVSSAVACHQWFGLEGACLFDRGVLRVLWRALPFELFTGVPLQGDAEMCDESEQQPCPFWSSMYSVPMDPIKRSLARPLRRLGAWHSLFWDATRTAELPQ